MARFHWTFIVALSVLLTAGAVRAADLSAGDDPAVATALAKAAPGDTITLASGDYHGGWTLPAGAPDKPVTIRAAHSGQVFISCTKITDTPVGVQMADHTRVEGLAFTGFVSGVLAKVRSDVAVADCVFYSNRSGVMFTKCKQGRVERCTFHSNPEPNAIRGVQLVVNRGGQNIVWEHNLIETVSPDEPEGAIFLEDGTHYTDCAVRWNVFAGPSKNSLVLDAPDADAVVVEHNLGMAMLSGGTQQFNTCAVVEPAANKNDTQIVGLDDKWKFADPTYLDYRPQSDSPARSAAPGGKDAGAFEANDEVYYVERALGDNSNNGKTAGTPWQFFDAVADHLQAGQTLYIVAGPYAGPLTLKGLHAKADKPTIIRAYGKAKFNIESIVVKDCQNLRLEYLQTANLSVDDSSGVTLWHCMVAKGQGATLKNSEVAIEHCAFWANKETGLMIGPGFKSVSITSSAFLANHTPMSIDAGAMPPPFARFNIGIGPGNPPAADTEEFKLPASAATGGRYGEPIGP